MCSECSLTECSIVTSQSNSRVSSIQGFVAAKVSTKSKDAKVKQIQTNREKEGKNCKMVFPGYSLAIMGYYALCEWMKKKDNDKPAEVTSGSPPKPDDKSNYCGFKKGFLLGKPKKKVVKSEGRAALNAPEIVHGNEAPQKMHKETKGSK